MSRMSPSRTFFGAEQIEKSISWLLANGSAPVRYLTHRHLLHTPAKSHVMRELWQEVDGSPDVREIFSRQDRDGSWCSGGSWSLKPPYALKSGRDPYTPKYVTAVWLLPLLGEIGYTARDARIRKACDFVIAHGYFRPPRLDELLNTVRQDPKAFGPCRFTQYMIAFGLVGLAADARARKGYEILLRTQREDGGWAWSMHYDMYGWTRSCPFATYGAVAALYHSQDPDYHAALVRGMHFLLRHLAIRKDHELRSFFYHGHSILHELAMFSEFGLGLRQRPVQTILNWLMEMHHPDEGCFRYNGKPVSKYTNREDGMEPRVAKYRLYHIIETDWLTYRMTRIAMNVLGRGARDVARPPAASRDRQVLPPSSVRLRKATAADSKFAFQTKKATLAKYVAQVWGWDEDEQSRMHETRFAAQDFRVVQVSDTDVGILASARHPDHIRVYQLLIRPEHQHQGIGTAVMTHVIRDAAARQLPVRIQVLKVNRRAGRFYRNFGFRIIGQDGTHLRMERPTGGSR